MTREEWLGKFQVFVEQSMADAPDEDCRALAEAILDEITRLPDDPRAGRLG
jgi:hypothetical protein